uniref:Pectinesterase n=1 Tax=Kalanchoe fedtschenkoi TaxID=63787 RepID=A0A7N0TDB7_KALFE
MVYSDTRGSKMSTSAVLIFIIYAAVAAGNQLEQAVTTARNGILEARGRIQGLAKLHGSGREGESGVGGAMDDCASLYGASHARLSRLVSGRAHGKDDGLTWLSSALAAHRTCLDGMQEIGFSGSVFSGQNLTDLLGEALASYKRSSGPGTGGVVGQKSGRVNDDKGGLLASWNPSTAKANFVVAKDGSGSHTTINGAVSAMSKMGRNRPSRFIVHVKAGVYNENVEIGRHLKNVMFVGDGIDKTVVTGSKNVSDGSTTYNSATFGVSGDGFWARDMTFENTAGPQKHQAVALRVNSDLSVFYRCSMRAYQDTLFTHSLRQFYRDCHIHGTIDFIFGDASAVIQNCNIFIRKPMRGQSNMITAQGRDHPDENTGIVIHASRVIPSSELAAVKNDHKNFLGRPWKEYSRTVFLKTDLDGLIHPKGWSEWRGDFALSTLYYGEYMNSGDGANTNQRVNWPGFHVLRSQQEASAFSVSQFLHGESWMGATGVPFWPGI